MNTRQHFVLSLIAAGALLPVLDAPLAPAVVLAYAAVVGTLVDLDHFLIARVKTGSWAPLRRALASPRVAFLDQEKIFDAGDVGALERLLSHVVLVGVAVGLLVPVSPPLAVLTAVVLYVHVLADLLHDVRQRAS